MSVYQHHHTTPSPLSAAFNFLAGMACAAAVYLALRPALSAIRAAAHAFEAALS